jgi:hypothetical protein
MGVTHGGASDGSHAARNLIESAPEFRIASRWGVPLFVDEEFCPRWALHRGRLPHRVFLATIPKAGTHMMAEMLTRFELVNCGIHVLRDHVVDQRFTTGVIARRYPSQLRRDIELRDTLRLIAPGQFAFGHIGLRDGHAHGDARMLFSGFKVVVMFRNLRDVYVSLLRYFRERGDMPAWGVEAELLSEWPAIVAWDMDKLGPFRRLGFEAMAMWRQEPNALCLRYEEVVGDLGPDTQIDALQRLTRFLGVEYSRKRLGDIAETVVGTQTVTKMDRRTVASEYWSDEVEWMYQRIGFPELNRELGYAEPSRS